MYSCGPPHVAEQKQDDQLKHTYSSSVGIRDVALKTSQRRWTIERSGEKGSGISVLAARHDDDDDDDILKYSTARRITMGVKSGKYSGGTYGASRSGTRVLVNSRKLVDCTVNWYFMAY